MPRYFFHVHDSKDLPDDEGTELPDDKAAKDQAVVLAGELLRELDGDFWRTSTWSLDVFDESGTEVCRLVLSSRSRG